MKILNRTELSRKRFHGFTLAELVVVITVLAVLATIGFLALSGYSQDAKDSAVKANVRSVHAAISSESAVSGNSPRYYVVHDTWAALSGAFAYVDGTQTFLTWGAWNQSGTNYSAGNPDYAKLKLNGEKFRVSASGLRIGTSGFGAAEAAYDARYLSVGAMDATVGNGGKTRSVSYFQVAGIAPATGTVSVSGNYPTSSGSVAWLVKDPKSSTSTWALVEGAASGMDPAPVSGVCGTAAKGYAHSASSFGSDTLCSVGTASPASPAFPAAGGSTNWTCSGQNGGNAPTCTATRAAAANCAVSTQTVNARSYPLAAFNNGATLAGTSAAVAVTGWTRTYSQTFLCTDGAVSTSGSETAGTVSCSADFGLNSNVCVPKSCRIQKEQANPSSTSGDYSIDPDWTGWNAPFTATCDMTTDGGGWTLVFYSNSDNVARSTIASWDWNAGPAVNFSRLYSMKNIKNASGLYEFFVKDSSTVGRYMTFTQTNAYDGNPVGNSFTKKTGNMYYSSQTSGSTWYGLALGSYGNSSNVTSCTLSTSYEWQGWTYCLQDQLSGSYGTGPWFYDISLNTVTGYDSGSQVWVQVYQR